MASNMSGRQRKSKRDTIFMKSGGMCAYCGCLLSKEKMTFDHIKPRAKGGSNKNHNLVAACNSCNTRKGSMTEAEFIKVLREERMAVA